MDGDRGGLVRLPHAGWQDDKSGLARDTVFEAVMIICNGLVGLCLLSGGIRHHVQGFQLEGASVALAVSGIGPSAFVHSTLSRVGPRR